MTAYDQFQIAVPDTGVAKLIPLGILRQDRPVKATGNIPDGVAQQKIAGKMLEVEKIPRMIDIHRRSHSLQNLLLSMRGGRVVIDSQICDPEALAGAERLKGILKGKRIVSIIVLKDVQPSSENDFPTRIR